MTFPLRWLIMEDSFTDKFTHGDMDMTELEIIQHTKDYLDKLAKGINLRTGREVPEGEIINNVRISLCLF